VSRRPRGIASVWPHARPLVGVVHLLPLPGAPEWSGSMDEVEERATADAVALQSAGFDGVIVENFSDAPFFASTVAPETVAAMGRATAAVRRSVAIPVGVNVLRNDAAAALGVAVAAGASFIRVNVHTGAMWTDQGLVEGRAAETLRRRAALGAEVAILADVHVKHAVPPPGSQIGVSARDCGHRGRAHALVVSGSGTGSATDASDLARVKEAVPDAVVLIGSGLTAESAPTLLRLADGAIVGSAVMEGGRAGGPIDPDRARTLIAAARR